MTDNSTRGNILIVDKDDRIAKLLKSNLIGEGYDVAWVESAKNVNRNELGDVCLIIADCMECEYSGMDLIVDIKNDPTTEHVGVILYSSINKERIVVDALNAGADDYIVKPFSLREIIARVKSILRRRLILKRNDLLGTMLCFEYLCIDLPSKTVEVHGKPISLTRTEYEILVLLLKNKNRYVPRTEIHRCIWPELKTGINERIVDTNISRLRKKLGNFGGEIVNRSRHGYMIC